MESEKQFALFLKLKTMNDRHFISRYAEFVRKEWAQKHLDPPRGFVRTTGNDFASGFILTEAFVGSALHRNGANISSTRVSFMGDCGTFNDERYGYEGYQSVLERNYSLNGYHTVTEEYLKGGDGYVTDIPKITEEEVMQFQKDMYTYVFNSIKENLFRKIGNSRLYKVTKNAFRTDRYFIKFMDISDKEGFKVKFTLYVSSIKGKSTRLDAYSNTSAVPPKKASCTQKGLEDRIRISIDKVLKDSFMAPNKHTMKLEAQEKELWDNYDKYRD